MSNTQRAPLSERRGSIAGCPWGPPGVRAVPPPWGGTRAGLHCRSGAMGWDCGGGTWDQ